MAEAEPHLGEQVFAKGWRQGSVFPADRAPFSWVEKQGAPPVWRTSSKPLKQDDFLVVAAQNCDIKKKEDEEPRVEVVRAFWTRNERIINFTGNNTVRYFIFKVRVVNGVREAFVAETRTRLHLLKKDLLQIAPESAFDPGDVERPLRFARWLALRYDRPAVPAALERAVQVPLRTAYEGLPPGDPVRAALARVDHILFQEVRPGSAARIQVHVYLMSDGGRVTAGPLELDDAALVADWIATVLGHAGLAELESWDPAGADTITYLAYVSHYALYLDE